MTGMQDTGMPGGRDPREQVTAVVLKILGIAVAIGLVIGIGAWVLVKSLGLDTASVSGTTTGQGGPTTPLPTTALPVPSQSGPAEPGATDIVTPPPTSASGLYLTAAPVIVAPMERINLTGQWPGHDNQGLMVQRLEGGKWADFGVHVNVNLGTFATYVMTGRTGDQKFRVFDPQSSTASNEVTVTVHS